MAKGHALTHLYINSSGSGVAGRSKVRLTKPRARSFRGECGSKLVVLYPLESAQQKHRDSRKCQIHTPFLPRPAPARPRAPPIRF